jgi:ABC-type glycerol-3-phosphate transport system substrate-binding protein
MKGNDLFNKKISRREMLKVLGVSAGAVVLSSCAPAATPAATEAPVVPTEVPVVPTEVPPPTAVPPTEAPAIVNLRYQNHWTKETDAHFKGMEWLYKEFSAKYPNIHIENILNPDSTESFKKIVADCAAGDCPDIIHEGNPDMWKAGYLLDLTTYLDADKAWKDLFIPSTFWTTEGHTWGLCAEFSPMPTIWNTRILEGAGVGDIPKTWDELLVASEKIKSFGKTPTSWEVGGSHAWHNILASLPGGMDAIAANQFDSPQMKQAFEYMKVFVDNKWLPANEIEITWQESIAYFVAEETAWYIDGAWTIANNIYSTGAAPDLRDVVKYAPYPGPGANGSAVELKVGTPLCLAAKLEEDPAKLDAAITFFKFWFSEEGAKQWVLLCGSPMGIEVDMTKIEGVDPSLLAFLGAQASAGTVYSLPSTAATIERGWDDCQSGLDTLLTGGSVDDAMATYQTEMSKYK